MTLQKYHWNGYENCSEQFVEPFHKPGSATSPPIHTCLRTELSHIYLILVIMSTGETSFPDVKGSDFTDFFTEIIHRLFTEITADGSKILNSLVTNLDRLTLRGLTANCLFEGGVWKRWISKKNRDRFLFDISVQAGSGNLPSALGFPCFSCLHPKGCYSGRNVGA